MFECVRLGSTKAKRQWTISLHLSWSLALGHVSFLTGIVVLLDVYDIEEVILKNV